VRGNQSEAVTATVTVAAAAVDKQSASDVGAALNQHVWPALAAMLKADYPARGAAGGGSLHLAPGPSPACKGSGCNRHTIEAAARSVAALLKCGAWGWGRAEREVLSPHAPGRALP
jgi:hypothetical protein